MNQLMGEKISIITAKAQTTRHRILGIVNDENYQIVFSDTPGVLDPHYALHEHMMSAVNTALKDGDVILFMSVVHKTPPYHEQTLIRLQKTSTPVLLLLNKIDLAEQPLLEDNVDWWHSQLPKAEILPISAREGVNIQPLWKRIVELIPESPPYYDKEVITDRPMRFFVSELIREKLLVHYQREVPYATQVEVETYKEEDAIIRIQSVIYVERTTQKAILIGHRGQKMKRIGIEARKDIERFVGKRVHLTLYVKVDKGWRSSDKKLKRYGY